LTGSSAGQRGSGAATTNELLFADAGLERKDGTLLLGGVSLTGIADRVGTPAFVYNAGAIRERFRSLDAALGPMPHRLCYAVKANSNLAVLRLLRDLGAGAYGFVMASNYNSRPRPPEIMVDEGKWWVAREREKVETLFSTEKLSPT
jgi:hypothetical protein